MPPENLFLVVLAALTCASAVMSLSMSYVPHPLLLQLVDLMTSALVIFTNGSVFIDGL